MTNINKFKTKENLTKCLSEKIIDDLKKAIKKNEKASLLVSGGSTPKALFESLSKSDIAWDKVNIGLCDERWIDASHKDSNENLVNTYLLQNYAKKANFVPFFIKDVKVEEAKELCSKNINDSLYPFDCVILGMGNDGHTASIFPQNKKLEEAFDLNNKCLCVNMKPSDAPYERMSLTRAAILSADNIYLHFEGKEKLEVFNEVNLKKDMNETPIYSILNQNSKSIEVYHDE